MDRCRRQFSPQRTYVVQFHHSNSPIIAVQVDTLAGISTYSDVINTVFAAWEGQLDNGNSYDDVQWVSIAYLRAGNLAQAQKYYDIAR